MRERAAARRGRHGGDRWPAWEGVHGAGGGGGGEVGAYALAVRLRSSDRGRPAGRVQADGPGGADGVFLDGAVGLGVAEGCSGAAHRGLAATHRMSCRARRG
ncbi:hypothetical protein GCM10010393_25960 [Streptomyces gobitricini]|uniref:Uncharacterized protein n=1 Tax=Streptomyces gobitricini TaxID=68211 RepID=A0ABN3LZ17_9ACTN